MMICLISCRIQTSNRQMYPDFFRGSKTNSICSNNMLSENDTRIFANPNKRKHFKERGKIKDWRSKTVFY